MKVIWIVFICLFCSPVMFAQNGPALLFSDLTFGPNTGWNNASSQGAAVTVWGKNFGATQGNSYVTIGGAQATSYPEWDVVGSARGLERITFYIPSGAAIGSQTISVTVNGVTSNTLPFTVDNTTPIYYIDVTNGNNTNTGRSTAAPWKDLYHATPCISGGNHPANACVSSGDTQYIVYVRGGTYSTVDPYQHCSTGFINIDNDTGVGVGSSTHQKAVISYPGETATLSGNGHPIVSTVDATCSGSTYGISYLTVSKFSVTGGDQFWQMWGTHNNIIGNTIQNFTTDSWSGIVAPGESKYVNIFGNLFSGCGATNYKHVIYIKSEQNGSGYDQTTQYIYLGYNEFRNNTVSGGAGAQVFVSVAGGSPYTTDYVYIYGNLFTGGNDGYVRYGDGYNVLGTHLYTYNNIFAPSATSGSAGLFQPYLSGGSVYNVYFYNNTYANPGTSDGGTYVGELRDNGSAQTTTTNNIWTPGAGQGALTTDSISGGWIHSSYDFWGNGTVDTTGEQTGISVVNAHSGNPQFVNQSAGDYHLQASSAARGVGTNLYSTLSSLPGGIMDYDGKLMPSSGLWDAGALQYAASNGSNPPAAPTGLTATVQ